jgi:hypothetical protein
MSPLEITGYLTEKNQTNSVPVKFEDGPVIVYKLGKDRDGEEIIACLQGRAGVGVDYSVVGKALIHKIRVSVEGKDQKNGTENKEADLSISNPNTKDHLDVFYIKGKERG